VEHTEFHGHFSWLWRKSDRFAEGCKSPEGAAAGVREVTNLRDGPRRIIAPADAAWDDFFDSPGIDLGERDQPEIPIRETSDRLRKSHEVA
jgi:hypothetical protein